MYYDDQTILFLDGQWLKASEAKTDLFCQTLHYGNGVFDGIRSYQTADGFNVFKAREHYERLLYSAEKIHIHLDYTVERLMELTDELLEKNNLTNAYIRPLVFLGPNMSLTPSNETHLMITAWEWEKYLGNDLLNVLVSSYQKQDPKVYPVDAKVTGHYANSILATTEARKKGFDEALLLDSNGYVAEGPGTNFFFEKDDVLYTPPADSILPGITRATIIDLARKLDYRVEEKFFTVAELEEADTAFFTGTAAEIIGIRSVNGQVFKGWKDSMGYCLFLAYRNLVQHRNIADFSLA